MVTVPGFLLRRLYVKQSLKSTGEGFEFNLKNGLGSGYAYKMQPLTADGEEIALDSTTFSLEDGKEMKFSDVSKENTFTLAMNKTLTIRAVGTKLEPGAHKIKMGFDVPGLGTLRFDFTDMVK
ncbi:MAG: hypothetical protein O2854_01915 [Chloroflexi bacterium]|nr:hypothetical protein [Chloroflexota bacterium]